jgi:hypothetical protein
MQRSFQKMMFDLSDLRFWVEAQKVTPTQCRASKKDFEGIPN